MPNQVSRKALHAYVSDSAHDRWHGFAAEQGVSVSAILEALAVELDSDLSNPDRGVELTWVVGKARQIDAMRRRRNR